MLGGLPSESLELQLRGVSFQRPLPKKNNGSSIHFDDQRTARCWCVTCDSSLPRFRWAEEITACLISSLFGCTLALAQF